MKIDLTCPVELWQYDLPVQDDDLCRLTLYNLSDKDVVSLQVTLAGYDAEGGIMSRQVERVQGVGGAHKSAFEIGIAMEGGAQAAGMELVIEKVWFDDATIWRRGNAHLAEYTPNTLPMSRRLEMLRFVAGPDAIGYPQDQGAVWLCVCGRANAASESFCRRCQREKLAIFEQYNQISIEEMVSRSWTVLPAKPGRRPPSSSTSGSSACCGKRRAAAGPSLPPRRWYLGAPWPMAFTFMASPIIVTSVRPSSWSGGCMIRLRRPSARCPVIWTPTIW